MDCEERGLDPLAKRSVQELIACILRAIVSKAVDERAQQRRLLRELGSELLEDLDHGRIFTFQLRDEGRIHSRRSRSIPSSTGLYHVRSLRS